MSDISTISGQSRAGGNYTVGGKTDRGTSIVEAGGSVSTAPSSMATAPLPPHRRCPTNS